MRGEKYLFEGKTKHNNIIICGAEYEMEHNQWSRRKYMQCNMWFSSKRRRRRNSINTLEYTHCTKIVKIWINNAIKTLHRRKLFFYVVALSSRLSERARKARSEKHQVNVEKVFSLSINRPIFAITTRWSFQFAYNIKNFQWY